MKTNNKNVQRVILSLGALATFLFIVVSCQRTSPEVIDSGEEMYVAYCSICHGENADGHGPMADLLKVEPPDLRLIGERRDGKFDKKEIHAIIDGTQRMEDGHGDSEMPIWFVVFANEDDLGRTNAPEKIDELVAYLETLQLKKAN